MNISYHHYRSFMSNGSIVVEPISTHDQVLADLLTESIPTNTSLKLRKLQRRYLQQQIYLTWYHTLRGNVMILAHIMIEISHKPKQLWAIGKTHTNNNLNDSTEIVANHQVLILSITHHTAPHLYKEYRLINNHWQ